MEDLIDAAKRENWKVVDRKLPEAAMKDANVVWAYTRGLKDSDGNVRDLAASLLAKANLSTREMQEAKPILRSVMMSDSNPYARYRSAFALAEHGDCSSSVVEVLREAAKDKDVSKIAKGYLKRIV
ncbi:MAG: HEAT repeat domain-containing protein [Nanoarchaeota archaeon]|nr:HEAT repeat domain-containing protein [Nanoarchaeota archaeon]